MRSRAAARRCAAYHPSMATTVVTSNGVSSCQFTMATLLRRRLTSLLWRGAVSDVASRSWFGVCAFLQPVLRQHVPQPCCAAIPQQNPAVQVPFVHLGDRLPAASARSTEDPVLTNGHHRSDMRFAVLEHLCNCSDLCAESETACKIDADTGVDIAFRSPDPCRHGASREVLAQSKATPYRLCRRDQLSIICFHLFLSPNY